MSRLVSQNTEAWENSEDQDHKLKKYLIKPRRKYRVFQYRYNLLKQQEMSVSLDSLGIAAILNFYAVLQLFKQHFKAFLLKTKDFC